MSEIEIGRGKRGNRSWAFDDVAIVPSRRTRDPQDVSTAWNIDAFKFDLPVLAAPMDSVVSPATAIQIGKLGGLGVLDLEGLWTRYENPEKQLSEIIGLSDAEATVRMQQIYAEPIKPELIRDRIAEIRAGGVTVAAALSPQRTAEFSDDVVKAGVDIFVIRGTTVSAEHVSKSAEPLNLKRFIYELDVPVIVGGAATYTSALHLMRTGAAGVLVGFGGGAASTTRKVVGIHAPMATAVADVAGARRDYMDESGGRYVHVIADGKLGVVGRNHFAYAQRAHDLADTHRRDVGLAFIHPATHGRVEGQVFVVHQHLPILGRAHRHFLVGEGFPRGCADRAFGEQELAVGLGGHGKDSLEVKHD